MRRPAGVTASSVFFMAGAVISGLAGLSLLFPGGFLEPMWRLNPRAREALGHIGGWGAPLFAAVCAACGLAAAGLWRGRRWGHRLAVGLIAVNLISDVVNVVLRTEPQALVGVPIAAALLVYLSSRRVREFFRGAPQEPGESAAR